MDDRGVQNPTGAAFFNERKMKKISINNQEELDKLLRVEVDQEVTLETALELKVNIEVFGTLILNATLGCGSGKLVVPSGAAPSIVARGSSAPGIERPEHRGLGIERPEHRGPGFLEPEQANV